LLTRCIWILSCLQNTVCFTCLFPLPTPFFFCFDWFIWNLSLCERGPWRIWLSFHPVKTSHHMYNVLGGIWVGGSTRVIFLFMFYGSLHRSVRNLCIMATTKNAKLLTSELQSSTETGLTSMVFQDVDSAFVFSYFSK
jgi:hypothetical protein